jgi:hypothetical protein
MAAGRHVVLDTLSGRWCSEMIINQFPQYELISDIVSINRSGKDLAFGIGN